MNKTTGDQFAQFVALLRAAGWVARNDAQHTRIAEAWEILKPNATAHVRAVASNVQQIVGNANTSDKNCDNCGYKVPEKTRLASQPKCERPIDNMDDACHNFAKWIPNSMICVNKEGE